MSGPSGQQGQAGAYQQALGSALLFRVPVVNVSLLCLPHLSVLQCQERGSNDRDGVRAGPDSAKRSHTHAHAELPACPMHGMRQPQYNAAAASVHGGTSDSSRYSQRYTVTQRQMKVPIANCDRGGVGVFRST